MLIATGTAVYRLLPLFATHPIKTICGDSGNPWGCPLVCLFIISSHSSQPIGIKLSVVTRGTTEVVLCFDCSSSTPTILNRSQN